VKGPPRPDLLVRILARLVPRSERDEVLGDLLERFEQDRRTQGEDRARHLLRRRTRSVAGAYLLARLMPGRLREPAQVLAARRGRPGRILTRAESLGQDLRHAWRSLHRSPLFTLVVIGCLALGLGINTAVLTFLKGVVLRPLPFPDPERLVVVFLNGPEVTRVGPSQVDLLDWRSRSHSFETLELYRGRVGVLRGTGSTERAEGLEATGGLFPLLGVEPVLGRLPGPEEERPGAPLSVLLSHRLWSERFGSDPGILGRSVTLDETSCTVLGIMPPGFRFEENARFWVTTRIDPASNRSHRRYAAAIGRLRAGVTVEEARRELAGIASQLAGEFPETNEGMGVVVRPLEQELLGERRRPVMVFYGAVCFLLLLGCINVAHLMLGRVGARGREIAIRSALGSGQARLLRMFFLEGLLLAAAAGVLGLVLAAWLRDLYLASLPQRVPYYLDLSIDPPLVAAVAVLTLLTAVLSGLLPGWQALRGDPAPQLRTGTGSLGLPRMGRRSVRSLLLVGECALTLVVLIGAGLMLKSLVRLRSVEVGFDPRRVLTMEVALPEHRPEEPEQVVAFFERVRERVAALPEVVSASSVSNLPMGRSQWQGSISFEPAEAEPVREVRWAVGRAIQEDYFTTMDIPLLAGRPFDERDVAGGPEMIIINESLARHCWPQGDWPGRRLRYGDEDSPWPWMVVVGVVGDLHHYGLDYPVIHGYYRPLSQVGFRKMTLVVRTRSDPPGLSGEIRGVVQELDPEAAVWDIRSMEQVIADEHWEPIAYSRLAVVFSLVALLLAALGIFGIVSAAMTGRIREFGLRLALGARPSGLISLVTRQVLEKVGLGLAAGLALSLLVMRSLAGLLFGVPWYDPPVYGFAALVLLGVALLAGALPARRAVRIDPVAALKSE
jgi:predicted permease